MGEWAGEWSERWDEQCWLQRLGAELKTIAARLYALEAAGERVLNWV